MQIFEGFFDKFKKKDDSKEDKPTTKHVYTQLELDKLHTTVKKCANKVYGEVQFKESFKLRIEKPSLNDFNDHPSIDFIYHDIHPIAKKYNINPREIGSGDNPKVDTLYNKNFNIIIQDMTDELRANNIKFKEVDYSGDWDSGYFTVYF